MPFMQFLHPRMRKGANLANLEGANNGIILADRSLATIPAL